MIALYASSYFDACVPPMTNTLLERSGLAPLKVSTFVGAFLRLFHFFLVDEFDNEDVPEVDSVPTDLISVVISEMIDRPMLFVAFAMRRKTMIISGVRRWSYIVHALFGAWNHIFLYYSAMEGLTILVRPLG